VLDEQKKGGKSNVLEILAKMAQISSGRMSKCQKILNKGLLKGHFNSIL